MKNRSYSVSYQHQTINQMNKPLRPVDALWLLVLADALYGSFAFFAGVPHEMEEHALALCSFFYSQCEELDPYGR